MSFEQVVAPSLEILDAEMGQNGLPHTGSGDTIRTDRNWYGDLATTLRKLVELKRLSQELAKRKFKQYQIVFIEVISQMIWKTGI